MFSAQSTVDILNANEHPVQILPPQPQQKTEPKGARPVHAQTFSTLLHTAKTPPLLNS